MSDTEDCLSIELSDEQRLLQETVRRFVRQEVAPKADEIDRDDRFPRDLMSDLGKLGLLGITVPEQYGGSGSGLLSQAIVVEELATASAGLASSYAAHSNLVADNLNRHASHDQKAKYLPDLCSGVKIGYLAITEPGSGSDALAMRTREQVTTSGWRPLMPNSFAVRWPRESHQRPCTSSEGTGTLRSSR